MGSKLTNDISGEAKGRRDLGRDGSEVSGSVGLPANRVTSSAPPSPAQPPPPTLTSEPASKIKILFLGANPSDTTHLALDHEVREISQKLRATPHSERFELVQEWAVRVDDLQAALLRHRPQLVHFSGHGRRGTTAGPGTSGSGRDLGAPSEVNAAEGSGEILVEDEAGRAAPIPASALADLFRIVGSVRCVVLNACHSAAQAEAIRQHVYAVVGMGRAIQDQAAINFAWAFYQGLGFGESVRKAFELGRNQIGLIGSGDVEVPKLLVRDGLATDDIRLVHVAVDQGTTNVTAFSQNTLLWASMLLGIAAAGFVVVESVTPREPPPVPTSTGTPPPEPTPTPLVPSAPVSTPLPIISAPVVTTVIPVPSPSSKEAAPQSIRFDRIMVAKDVDWEEFDRTTPNRVRWMAETLGEPIGNKDGFRCPGNAMNEYWCKHAAQFFRTRQGQLSGPFPDPTFDVTLSNVGKDMLVITEVGVQIAHASFWVIPGGEPTQGSVTIAAKYAVRMPRPTAVRRVGTTKTISVADICKKLNEPRKNDEYHEYRCVPKSISNVEIETFLAGPWEWADAKAVAVRLGDPWYIKSGADPYRFHLTLRDYNNMPTDVVLRIVIKTSDGSKFSDYLYLVAPANRSGH